ncbi:conserved hypothetical protein [Alteracholeplasma palmae J233]|uniref:Uncharacterized protein n=1 Tax=Alteracholeplasma palmae (strain ATCC 49389 / J233) TaxID=1318466 RepID=U4KLN0_ALTPJ|nr:hypothetical protein [Alteracholeplasma palmae]CCV64783.1 conserved hypothetical protein [Alteracholeplasma palmae J233]
MDESGMTIFSIFGVVFLIVLVITLVSFISRNKKNNTPIKKIRVGNTVYYLYSIMPSYGRYNNTIVYQLKDKEGNLKGNFNSLSDVLSFLGIDEFPDENDIFN